MSGWSNLSNELFLISHNTSQRLLSGESGKSFCKSAGPVKQMRQVKGALKEWCETVDEPDDCQGEDQIPVYLEQESVQVEQNVVLTEPSIKESFEENRYQETHTERLREAVLWAEILGAPVSVKRRKKRMKKYYGY